MQKRLILAIFLSGLVLFFYNLYYFQNIPEEKKEVIEKKKIEKKKIKISLSKPKTSLVKSNLKIDPEDLRFKNNLFEVALSSYGNIKDFRLNDYLDEKREKVAIVKKAEDFRGPLSLILDGHLLKLKGFNFKDDLLKEFFYLHPSYPEIEVVKRYKFSKDSYAFILSLILRNSGRRDFYLNNLKILWASSNIGNIDKNSPNNKINQTYFKGSLYRVKYKGEGFFNRASAAIKGERIREEGERFYEVLGNLSWISEHDQYFASIIIPENNVDGALFKKDKDTKEMAFYIKDKLIKPKEVLNLNFKVYLGPKKFEELKALSNNIEELSGLNSLALIILWTLKTLYKFCHNYGVAIILLTILVKIILYPLTAKSLKSMKALNELQPKLAQLKEKYKDNKEKFNQELMFLYKRHKVNPLGGCLPLILQLPVFYALFTTFQTSIELRRAKFIFWLEDLSLKDPYYVLPILMGITMLIQQKMTPTPDPKQAKMMLIMPIVFTILFLNFPAGLMLYWLIQNILSIAQQYIIMHSNKS
jgi:YidC/Oxa1 family membrane protein insertase